MLTKRVESYIRKKSVQQKVLAALKALLIVDRSLRSALKDVELDWGLFWGFLFACVFAWCSHVDYLRTVCVADLLYVLLTNTLCLATDQRGLLLRSDFFTALPKSSCFECLKIVF